MDDYTDLKTDEKLTNILGEVRKMIDSIGISNPVLEYFNTEMKYDRVKLNFSIKGRTKGRNDVS